MNDLVVFELTQYCFNCGLVGKKKVEGIPVPCCADSKAFTVPVQVAEQAAAGRAIINKEKPV